ncbi:MAG: methylmalonyl-CoA mutase family protein [Thermoleophilia bacterium]
MPAEQDVVRVSPSGIPLERIYGPDTAGEYPFTRGIHRDMYRGKPWTMRQYSGLGSARETNERYRFLLAQGATGLSVALDLPTQVGYDSDDPDVEEEVGRVGVAIDTLADLETVFAGIPLDQVTTSFTINGTAAILLAMYVALAERQGVPPERIRGTVQNDILKEYVARGTWIFPAEPSLRLIVDTIEFCLERAPRFNPISVAGAHFRDAGASAVQELAFTLADGITYVERCLARGLDVDEVGRQLSFFFYTHTDFFEEVAKYRAGRRLWARIMRERFGATSDRACMFRFGCVCGGASLTAEQPLNNVVRVSYQALAAVLGGVQSMFTCAWDEALTLPSVETAELALRTQQVLADETGVTTVVDPLGGSWFVEELTDRFERECEAIIARIEELGGMVRCVEEGVIQRWIAERAYEEQRRLETGERPLVGVNRYRHEDESPPELEFYEVDEDEVRAQIVRLGEVRASRDAARVERALAELRRGAEGTDNLMPILVECCRAYCTVGEMVAVLREVFGVFREPVFA